MANCDRETRVVVFLWRRLARDAQSFGLTLIASPLVNDGTQKRRSKDEKKMLDQSASENKRKISLGSVKYVDYPTFSFFA